MWIIENNMDYKSIYKNAVRWAKYAGKILLSRKPEIINSKLEFDDIVTTADLEVEVFLKEKIKKHYPHHQIITEEAGEVINSDCGEPIWIIDPLDGTKNYVHGFPHYCVSICYWEVTPKVGVVYNPIRNELFSSMVGIGAWLNGEKIKVSRTNTMNNALFSSGYPKDWRKSSDDNIDNINIVSYYSHGVRKLGATALDLCYVASGVLDGFWGIRQNLWDIAAGSLIVIESGGVVSKLDGTLEIFSPPYSILATNSNLHDDLVKLFLMQGTNGYVKNEIGR